MKISVETLKHLVIIFLFVAIFLVAYVTITYFNLFPELTAFCQKKITDMSVGEFFLLLYLIVSFK